MDWVFLAELSVNGALTGLLYSLFAIGLVLVYKSSSVPNLAQGALTMLGAYVVLAFSQEIGYSPKKYEKYLKYQAFCRFSLDILL